MPILQERLRTTPVDFTVPPGFETYFTGREHLSVIEHRDLLPQIKQVELGRFITRLEMYQLPPKHNLQRHMVFIEDVHGYRTLMFVAKDTLIPPQRHPDYGPLAVIGGTGVYPTPPGRTTIEYLDTHTDALALAMRDKTAIAGLRQGFGLSGMKATVAMEPGNNGLSDWEKSVFLQMATGWLYNPEIFYEEMTGTDARQTENTIGAMALGSAFANPDRVNVQICGTRKNFDTPGACSMSLEAILDALHSHNASIPTFEESVVSVQGFGRIGRPAVELALRRGAKHIFLSEVKFTVDEQGNVSPRDGELYQTLLELQQLYPGQIEVVNDIYAQKADIFMPCSSREEMLTEETIQQLHSSGIRVILAGANKILEKRKIWELARLAKDLEIVMPPEVLSNCGSVTMAGLERFYHHLRRTIPQYMDLTDDEAEKKFVQEFVQEFIRSNAQNMVTALLDIAETENTDLYTAGKIWCRRQFNQPVSLNANGILKE